MKAISFKEEDIVIDLSPIFERRNFQAEIEAELGLPIRPEVKAINTLVDVHEGEMARHRDLAARYHQSSKSARLNGDMVWYENATLMYLTHLQQVETVYKAMVKAIGKVGQ